MTIFFSFGPHRGKSVFQVKSYSAYSATENIWNMDIFHVASFAALLLRP